MQWSKNALSDAVVLADVFLERIDGGEHCMRQIDIVGARQVHDEHIHQIAYLCLD